MPDAKSLAELGIVLPKPAGSGRQTEVFDDRAPTRERPSTWPILPMNALAEVEALFEISI